MNFATILLEILPGLIDLVDDALQCDECARTASFCQVVQ